MYFQTWSDLLTMDGHGPYVWFCVVFFSVVIAAVLWQPWQRQRQFLKQQAQLAKRQQRRQQP